MLLRDVISVNESVGLAQRKPGDRWMACTDGLSGVVPDQLMKNILLSNVDIQEAGELLVGEALEFGAPDNVTVIVADIVAGQPDDESLELFGTALL